MWALPTQGFGAGELLPATFDAVADLHADAVHRTVGDTPAVLLGSSSGGILALSAARRLQEQGASPAAVVLLDTYMPRADSPFLRFSQQMLGGMFDRESMFAHMDTDRLTAMSWYVALIGEWEPGPLDCPVLLVRSSEPPVPAAPGEELPPQEWRDDLGTGPHGARRPRQPLHHDGGLRPLHRRGHRQLADRPRRLTRPSAPRVRPGRGGRGSGSRGRRGRPAGHGEARHSPGGWRALWSGIRRGEAPPRLRATRSDPPLSPSGGRVLYGI